jgi:hypothetical protein
MPMKTIKRPPLIKDHRKKRLQWASQYTDEIRATWDGKEAGFLHGCDAASHLRRQPRGERVKIWVGNLASFKLKYM